MIKSLCYNFAELTRLIFHELTGKFIYYAIIFAKIDKKGSKNLDYD